MLRSKSRAWLRQLIPGPVSGIGLLGSVALPAGWILHYYSFILHVWLSLGRWPRFGEALVGWALLFQFALNQAWFLLLHLSLAVAVPMFLACACRRSWRHLSLYCLCHGAGIGAAWIALNLAPPQFLNWLYD